MNNILLYQIALCTIKNIGDVTGKTLMSYLGTPEEIFKAKKQQLMKVPGVGEIIAERIIKNKKTALEFAEKELKRIEKYNIKTCFYTDADYPTRLKFYNDTPLLLYYQGTPYWNEDKIIAIVGTRKITNYGRDLVSKFIAEIKEYKPVILSGLAYGTDALSHQAALDNDLKTMAVLGNGLPQIYPPSHNILAKQIIKNGTLISELPVNTPPDAHHFPQRNRIVAGMADAVIVVESKTDGGSMITASIANSYNKDVFAFPGRTNDLYSSGCNALIKLNKAIMIENAGDFLYFMNWAKSDKKENHKGTLSMPFNLNPEQEKIINLLREKNKLHIDELSYYAQLSPGQLSITLLEMEMNNWVRVLPGKMYELCI